MNRKVKEESEKTRKFKTIDKFKKRILRGERNVKQNDRVLAKAKEIQQKFHWLVLCFMVFWVLDGNSFSWCIRKCYHWSLNRCFQHVFHGSI